MDDFLKNLIVPALVALAAWIGVNLIGKPVLAVRDARLEGIKAAERHGYVSFLQNEERIAVAQNVLGEASSKLRSLSRGQDLAARLYCRFMRYDLENAARAINGLAQMAGGNYEEQVKKNTLNYLYYSLNAHGHLSEEDMLELKIALKKQGAST